MTPAIHHSLLIPATSLRRLLTSFRCSLTSFRRLLTSFRRSLTSLQGTVKSPEGSAGGKFRGISIFILINSVRQKKCDAQKSSHFYV
jgi:hypothetical protein